MNKKQEKLANTLLNKFKEAEGTLNDHYFGEEINMNRVNWNAVVLGLIELKLIEEQEEGWYRLTEEGWNFSGFARIE